ncbi:hypothetical protein RND81_09G229200 [Saponaria officinalis]|uniref:Rapid ALkalinization Factor n=1 Tax=Saponaria officinalis TaxID=3572 RepID=A0AAW1IRX9_SAPOF
MGKPKSLLLILAICFFYVTVHANDNENSSTTPLILNRPVCNGAMGECLVEDELEFELDSEINRRILATQGSYVSYGALNKNKVPCSRRGASYYNCQPGAQANPYSRGCSKMSGCARS